MQYVDCDRAEKHGNLCLGYSGDTDEPCEQCKNCIKCESGTYQLGETEKDDQLAKARGLLRAWFQYCIDTEGKTPLKIETAQFLKEIEK